MIIEIQYVLSEDTIARFQIHKDEDGRVWYKSDSQIFDLPDGKVALFQAVQDTVIDAAMKIRSILPNDLIEWIALHLYRRLLTGSSNVGVVDLRAVTLREDAINWFAFRRKITNI